LESVTLAVCAPVAFHHQPVRASIENDVQLLKGVSHEERAYKGLAIVVRV